MYLLNAERQLKELCNRYYLPDKQSWEKEWKITLAKVKATGKPWLQTKQWHKHEVDFELRDEWLEKLNLFARLHKGRVISVCAGHPHGVSGLGSIQNRSSGPSFGFSCRSHEHACDLSRILAIPRTEVNLTLRTPNKYTYYGLRVSAAFVHTGKNQERSAAWWEEILRNLETTIPKAPR